MKKRVYVVILAVLVIFSLTACNKDKSSNSDVAGKEKIRIVLDWTPNTNHTGLYVAREKGYFAEQGLEAEIMQPPEGSTTSLVGAGGAEFGISFQDSLAATFASNNPIPVTAVATIIQHNTSGILSLKETAIDRPAKMSGHSYATWDTPVELAMIKKIVEDDGGSFEEIELIPNTVTDVVTALQTDIESVWVYYAWDGIATEVAGLETNYLNFADYGTELDLYTPVIIANDSFLKNKPELVKKALEAIKKGYEFAIENPEEAADILLTAAPELDEELVKRSQEWLKDRYKAEVAIWGYIDQERWDGFFGWLFDNKLIEQEIPAGYGFSNEYLP